MTWTTDGLVTGFAQQTASIVRVDAETIAIVFSHKDISNGTAYGQRAIFSYDRGKTYSNVILELHHGGMCVQHVPPCKAPMCFLFSSGSGWFRLWPPVR